MKTNVRKTPCYICSMAVGVRRNVDGGRAELSLVCSSMLNVMKSRLDNIDSIHVRIALKEHELVAYSSSGIYLGILFEGGARKNLGAVRQLEEVLTATSDLELRVFSMRDTESSITKTVQGCLVYFDADFLPSIGNSEAA